MRNLAFTRSTELFKASLYSHFLVLSFHKTDQEGPLLRLGANGCSGPLFRRGEAETGMPVQTAQAPNTLRDLKLRIPARDAVAINVEFP